MRKYTIVSTEHSLIGVRRPSNREAAGGQDVREEEGGSVGIGEVRIIPYISNIFITSCRLVRECHSVGDEKRIGQIIDQLIDHFAGVSNALHVRNGGLIGLAGTGIALGVDIAPYMNRFLDPLLTCFSDPENRVRYFAAECLYNIAKVSKGEVLVYFNPIFDALSKVRRIYALCPSSHDSGPS